LETKKINGKTFNTFDMKEIKLKNTSRILDKLLIAFGLTITLLSCDMLESDPDVLEPSTNFTGDEIVVLANAPSFIDLNATLKTNVPARVAVTSEARYGAITDLGKGVLQYIPSNGNSSARDGFEFTVYSLNNEVIKRDTIVIVIEHDSTRLPCNLYPKPDFVYGVGQDSVKIDVTANDIICGSDVNVSIFKPASSFPPHHGYAHVYGKEIYYTPKPSFQGTDKIIYKLTATNDSTRVAYSIVYITRDSACTFRLSNDQFVFNESTADSLLLLPVFQNDSLCRPLNSYTVNLKLPPAHGQATRVPDGFTYQAPPTAVLPFDDYFTYEVCADAVCKIARVDVKLKKDSVVFCPIYAKADSFDISTISTNKAQLPVLQNDSICGELTRFKITKQPLYGSAAVELQKIAYLRNNSLSASDSLEYEICDKGGCSRATVFIKRN
jgi:hypothetical protein